MGLSRSSSRRSLRCGRRAGGWSKGPPWQRWRAPWKSIRMCCTAGRREFRQGPGERLPGQRQQRWAEGRVAELERKIGRQALEIDFLKGCLQRIEQQRMLQALTGNPRFLRFAGCFQFAMEESGRSRNFHRTANSLLTVCVNPGDHPKHHPRTRPAFRAEYKERQ